MGHQSTGSWSVFPALQDSGSWVPIFREKYMIYVHIWKTHEFNPGIFHDIPCRLDYFTWSLRPTNSLRSLTDSSLRDEESATAIPRCFFVAAALAQKKRCCLSRLAGVCGQTSVDSFNPSVVTLQLDELLFAYLYQFFFLHLHNVSMVRCCCFWRFPLAFRTCQPWWSCAADSNSVIYWKRP